MLLNVKNVFWFSLQLSSETFLILKRNERDIMVFMLSTLCSCPVNDTWILSTDFREILKFYENLSSGSRVPCGRADTMKLMAAFRNFANAHKNWWWEYLKCVLAVEFQVGFDRYLGKNELSIMLGYVYIVMFFFGFRSYLTTHSVPVIKKTHGGTKICVFRVKCLICVSF
jgi:hypothetical protein